MRCIQTLSDKRLSNLLMGQDINFHEHSRLITDNHCFFFALGNMIRIIETFFSRYIDNISEYFILLFS